ncbi:MAG: glycosyltransferase family 87 protein [Rhodomicrobiaceae bacterium]
MSAAATSVKTLFENRPQWAWAAAILVGGAIHLCLWPLSEPPILFSDFMKAYWVAAEHLWNGGLSAHYPFTLPGNWSNLPILAWPFALLVPLGREGAAWAYLIAGLIVTLATWVFLARFARLSGPMAAALLFLFFLNGPLLNTLREGNSTHFVLFFLVLTLVLWEGRREYLAGLALGMAATIKLPLLLFGVYFFLRRRWAIVAGGATTVTVAVLLSLAIFGFADHVQWYDDSIGFATGGAVPAFNAQSIDGFLMRLSTGAEELLYWGPIEPSLLHKIARDLALLVLFGGFGWFIFRTERQGLIAPQGPGPTPHDLLQFSIIIILSLIASPLTWTHYYAFLLVPLALYLGGRLPLPGDATTRWLFWTGYALASLPVIMPKMSVDAEPPFSWQAELAARTIVSAWLFGALIMLACFARGAWLATAIAPSSRAVPEASGAIGNRPRS